MQMIQYLGLYIPQFGGRLDNCRSSNLYKLQSTERHEGHVMTKVQHEGYMMTKVQHEGYMMTKVQHEGHEMATVHRWMQMHRRGHPHMSQAATWSAVRSFPPPKLIGIPHIKDN